MRNKYTWARRIAVLLLVGYLLLVLWAAFLSKGEEIWYYSGKVVLWPFASYRAAARDFDMQQWRNIMLNICMMVPFGFLIPIALPRMRQIWKVYLVGLLLIIALEAGQLLAGCGIFAMDDIIDHFLGVMIGYGFFRIIAWIMVVFHKTRERRHIRAKNSYKESQILKQKEEELARKVRGVPVLLYQLPLVAVIASFSWIFISYDLQELGNLNCAYASRAILADTDITVRTAFSDKDTTAMVYEVPMLSTVQASALAEELFAGIGMEYFEEENSNSDSMICYRSLEHEAELWIDLDGGTYMLTDYTERVDSNEEPVEGQSGATETAIRSALESWKIDLPQGCRFEEVGDGQYAFYAEQLTDGDRIYNGSVLCDYNVRGRLSRVDNQILVCSSYKEYTIISEKEAYEKLIAGKFHVWSYENGLGIESLEINGISLEYSIDSKRFYQPVYRFESVVNGETTEIDLPAIR